MAYPNKEVRQSFIKYLSLTYFSEMDEYSLAVSSLKFIREGNVESFMLGIERFLADIPFESISKIEEAHFHKFVYLLCRIIGLNTKTEYHTSNGSIDMIVDVAKYYYIIEFKIDKSPQAALDQIQGKDYPAIVKGKNKQTILTGANFSTKTRRLDGWISESIM